LALELAAARIGLFTPEELAARLPAGIDVLTRRRREVGCRRRPSRPFPPSGNRNGVS
jgi:hypothetical protein